MNKEVMAKGATLLVKGAATGGKILVGAFVTTLAYRASEKGVDYLERKFDEKLQNRNKKIKSYTY